MDEEFKALQEYKDKFTASMSNSSYDRLHTHIRWASYKPRVNT